MRFIISIMSLSDEIDVFLSFTSLQVSMHNHTVGTYTVHRFAGLKY